MDAWETLTSNSTLADGDAWEHLGAQGGGDGENAGASYGASSFSLENFDAFFSADISTVTFSIKNAPVIFTDEPAP